MVHKIANKIKWLIADDQTLYPAISVDEDLHSEIRTRLENLEADDGGSLMLVRPPKENEGMDASIQMYETFHDPRAKNIGLGPLSLTSTDAHVHAHEIWYHNDQMQFYLRPETRVDGNQFARQVRKNYPNAEIQKTDQRFPEINVGDHVCAVKLRLKRDFYYPIKSKLCSEDEFELDPYGDITSDMVVEEDQTSSGQRVVAKDCRLLVQTTFESARDVWSKQRPFGFDVVEAAAGMKEGQLTGDMVKGYQVRDPGSKSRKAAEMLEKLRGQKAYYITMRVIAISPYEEIAQRRCYTVATDFEKYYNSITEQGLKPIQPTEGTIRSNLLKAASRTHNIGLKDRLSGGKFLQPVAALGALAHIPNEEINTPVVDWAKQDTGPGTPSTGPQKEDEQRRNNQSKKERKQAINSSFSETKSPSPSNSRSESIPQDTNSIESLSQDTPDPRSAEDPIAQKEPSGSVLDTLANPQGQNHDRSSETAAGQGEVELEPGAQQNNSDNEIESAQQEESVWGSGGRR